MMNRGSDYVFFFTYMQVEPKDGKAMWSNAEEMAELNGRKNIVASSAR